MAINALQSASSALSALNTALDVTANNLANINTDGFKASRANFQDLLYLERAHPGTTNANDDQRPTGLYVGLGVRVSGTQVDFGQGAARNTGRSLDIMIEGEGFFQVGVEEGVGPGGLAFSRAGNLTLNADGELVMANDQGRRLDPPVQIPPDAKSISIATNGEVFVTQEGAVEPTQVGQIDVATFINPAGLKQVGENLFVETSASGAPNLGEPGAEGRGSVKQGFLEASNVDPTRELIDLIRTQRGYEFNSQSIRAADESLRTVAQIRR
ncbi:MAG TPA: flagellar basal-body rod protein FlgG [Phycisphaerales bacterium]|nr:flagellar basal-body rod protein FlgG [Phycisphaerales bacterium]